MNAERVISEIIPAPPNLVRDFYVDLDNLRTLHPLIVAVQRTARTVGPDGYVSDYRVQDRIPFGRSALPVTYTATLHVPVEGRSGPRPDSFRRSGCGAECPSTRSATAPG